MNRMFECAMVPAWLLFRLDVCKVFDEYEDNRNEHILLRRGTVGRVGETNLKKNVNWSGCDVNIGCARCIAVHYNE